MHFMRPICLSYAIFFIAAYAVNTPAIGNFSSKVNTPEPPPAAGSTRMQGHVTHVSDGDTLWLRDARGARRKLRFEGIDAPELCQPHGAAARAALRERVQGKEVVAISNHRDDYGRHLVRLKLDGEDLGAWMVQSGHAWSYRYRRNDGPYASQEREARSARKGLFASPTPERPADFRRRHGPCQLPD